MNKKTFSDISLYNEDYYERGIDKGVSGYANYCWMPELTLRMAHYLITQLDISKAHKILDFGCAKGYLVRALRILDIDAYGVDVSSYAISQVDQNVKEFCTHISGCDDPRIFGSRYEMMISKDVFEHITEVDLRILLTLSKNNFNKIFTVIPLAADNISGKYIIPEYDADVTHILAKTKDWWINLFQEMGWRVAKFDYTFNGCKENWTNSHPKGNGFFLLELV